ncbi:MAG TPA: xanthine dehydrogenase family protein subunit M [Ktedonobacteraceae bacterium]
MKPPRFRYCAPRILDDALLLLEQAGAEAKILAGGQSLVPLLNMRLAAPAYLLDINRVAELNYIQPEDDYLAIGATTRQCQAEHSSLIQENHPLLIEAIWHIGHMQIRNRGTVVGSLAHADPAAELPTLLTCLEGELLLQSSSGERLLSAESFFHGYLETALEADEMVVEARFPWLDSHAGWAFDEFARRSGDFALVGAAVVLTPAEDGTCQAARIAYSGVAGAPVRARAVEDILEGQPLNEQTLSLAADAAREVVSADMHDLHATVEYRRVLTAELTRRILPAAWARCRV